jgi:phage tail-like protein
MEVRLPVNLTAFERAVEQVSRERYPLDADVIRRAKNPWECPEHLLPYLAHELSVDLWDDAWPTTKKRAVIARSIGLSRIKGTEAGIAEAVEIMGGKVLSVIVPPATLFLSITRTAEEKAAWLARMPQLRIYPRRLPTLAPGMHVGPLSSGFTFRSTAFFEATPRVTIWRDGVETELLTLERRREDPTISDADEFIEAREPGPFVGAWLGSLGPFYPQVSTARSRVYTIRTRRTLTIPGSDDLAAQFAGPSLEPVDVRAETIREAAPVFGLWCGGATLGAGTSRYIINSPARLHVFKRVHLYDPDVPGAAHSGQTFLGYNSRFGEPAFNAELKIKIEQPRPPAAFNPLNYGYLLRPNQIEKRKITEAVLTHKSRRDRILINSHTRDTVTAGLNVTAGDGVYAGQIVAT